MPIRPILAMLLLLFASSASAADWREEVGAFRVGIVAGAGETTERLEPFRLALTEALGLNVDLFVARDYVTLVGALIQSRIEYAILSGGAHALAEANCECLEPLVIARSGDGSAMQVQMLLTRHDGPDAIAGLKRARIGALRATAFGGFEIALDGLRREGVEFTEGGAELQRFDRGVEMLTALAEKRIDAALVWGPENAGAPGNSAPIAALAAFAAVGGDPSAFRPIWRSVAIPNRLHSVRRNLPAEAKAKLREVLPGLFSNDPVAYDAVEPEYGGGFVVARQAQIEPLIEIVRRLREPEKPAK